MANQITTEPVTRSVNITRSDLDMAGNFFARQVSALPGMVGQAGKLKNFKVTNNASAGTVTTITLPADTYAVYLYVVTAAAIVAFAFGSDTPAVGTSTAAVGGAAYTGQLGVGMVVPADETSMKLVSDTNSAVVVITALIA